MDDDDLMTVGESQTMGLRAVHATCLRCFKQHRLALDDMPDAIQLRDGPREAGLRCKAFSGVKFSVRPDWRDFKGPPPTKFEVPEEPRPD